MPLVVRDQHQRGTVGGQLVEQRDHLVSGPRIEVPGRFVGEHDHRALGDRAGDRHTLALASRKLLRAMPQPVFEADPLERVPGGGAALAHGRARVEHPGRDVVERASSCPAGGSPGTRTRSRMGPQPGELPVGRRDHVAPGDLDRAAGRPLERAEQRSASSSYPIPTARPPPPGRRSALPRSPRPGHGTPPGYSLDPRRGAASATPFVLIPASPSPAAPGRCRRRRSGRSRRRTAPA